VCGVVGQDADKTTLLFTGANMRNVSVQMQQFRDMVVYALVTAGVETNAVRCGTDSGDFYELGTVNILILTNMQLTPRSMTRAIIDATEAKTAALQDLDIRSCYTPSVQATGTGTDNIIVVEGRGPKIDNAGGHSKLGELIARAVHASVLEAIGKQNGLHAKRSIFQRMRERNIELFGITSDCLCGSSEDKQRLVNQLEELLLQPQYAGFIESAFTLSDAFEKGLTCDLEAFELMCQDISNRVAGSTVTSRNTYMKQEFAPKVIRMAFDALINGLLNRRSSQEKK
jgi:adenosylcobinamide amidohydrolase